MKPKDQGSIMVKGGEFLSDYIASCSGVHTVSGRCLIPGTLASIG